MLAFLDLQKAELLALGEGGVYENCGKVKLQLQGPWIQGDICTWIIVLQVRVK